MGQKRKASAQDQPNSSSLGLSAPTTSIDPALSSLFASSSGPVKPRVTKHAEKPSEKLPTPPRDTSSEPTDSESSEHPVNSTSSSVQSSDSAPSEDQARDSSVPTRKRRKIDPTDDLEARYLDRLARDEDDRQASPRLKTPERGPHAGDSESAASSLADDIQFPLHETLTGESSNDASLKNKRTVFFGNVSTNAIKSKSAKKTLINHISSFLPSLPSEAGPHKLESIRFRSVAFSSNIPRKAAYAKREIMDETTKATNAYVIYSSEIAARKAVKHLNGTVILDRHLRADLVAHPSKIDHRRCVFVGNLSFVDEESPQNNEEDEANGQRRKRGREPADAEEGLWRTFGKCGTVESVRVIRDQSTRIGKGFAYVQFTDENAVEAALLYNEKKFPPMLPRKLRVMRAKSVKRKDMNKRGRMGDQRSKGPARTKTFGGKVSKPGKDGTSTGHRKGRDGGIRKPESFVFEGHRASKVKDRVPGSKLKAKSSKKPQNRSTKRAAAYRAAGKRSKNSS